MKYESLGCFSKDELESTLRSQDVDDEAKIKALYSAIYNHEEDFSSALIIYCMKPGVLESPILAARSILAFMQSRRSVVGVVQFLIELGRLKESHPNYEGEIQEILEDVEELNVILSR